MQSATDYLRRTESAVRLLFAGIAHYHDLLEQLKTPIHSSSQSDEKLRQAELDAWYVEHSAEIQVSFEVQRAYIAESFAQATLSGSVLQVAEKALEVYSTNSIVPQEWNGIVRSTKANFCIGRRIRTVPLGLIIHAARNQHAHYNERPMHQLTKGVFDVIATKHGYPSAQVFQDPAFDLTNPRLDSIASNVLGLIRWRTYEDYACDMAEMLGT